MDGRIKYMSPSHDDGKSWENGGWSRIEFEDTWDIQEYCNGTSTIINV